MPRSDASHLWLLFLSLILPLLVTRSLGGKPPLRKPGPWVQSTEGEPWPLPASRKLYDETFIVDADNLAFEVKNENCDILDEAIKRYKDIILTDSIIAEKMKKLSELLTMSMSKNPNKAEPKASAANEQNRSIKTLNIQLIKPCELEPHIHMNESYDLIVPEETNNEAAMLAAESIWGILRGLETFSQLIYPTNKGLFIRMQRISDFPKLPHRGLLIDTGRHFIPIDDILLTLDAMSYNKLNVLHWHIVDDDSFPYLSNLFPDMALKGAFYPLFVYPWESRQRIVEYGRMRGIRVIPEFDSPGHAKSWGVSKPEILTTCYDKNGKPTNELGPVNPTSDVFYEFVAKLFKEAREIFTDHYFHIGGDEVSHDCWKSNPQIKDFMAKNNMTGKYEQLEELHHRKLIHHMESKIRPIVWQEVFDRAGSIVESAVVQVWTGDWREEIDMITSQGFAAILSTCWYLDHIAGGGDWIKFYDCDPLDFKESVKGQKEFVIGGEACMWGEFVDRNNMHPRIWPRASATAEKLWSTAADNIDKVAARLEEQTCRMNRRGIPAQPPNGPGYCVT